MTKEKKTKESNRTFCSLENYECQIPKLIPTSRTLVEALDAIEIPLRAISDSIETLNKQTPALPSIKEAINIYLDQLDYIVRHTKLIGARIEEAVIEHPFRIMDL